MELTLKSGVRFYNGVRNVALRQVYAFNSSPRIGTDFEGEVVFGKPDKSGNDPGENSYSGISVDGIFQNFLYGPAARLHYATGSRIRDVAIRGVHVGLPYNSSLYAGLLFGGAFEGGQGGGGSIADEVPIAEAIVQLDEGTFDGLVVERIQPYYPDAGLPQNTSGNTVQLINKPHLVDRIVYSGPYDAQYAYGVYETQGPTVARRGLTHDGDYQIKHNDPMYHRVTVDEDEVVITLPRITRVSGVTPNDRDGLEFHIMRVGGSGLAVKIEGAYVSGPFPFQESIRSKGNPGGFVIYLALPYTYVRVRAVSEGGSRYWEVIDSEL